MTKFRLRAAFAAVCLTLAAPLMAQPFPSKPIRIVIPSTPGGTHDIIARAIAPKLQAELGQPVVVENKAGGASMIATRVVLQAPGDGYTLLMQSPSMVTASLAYKNPGYTMSQFVAVAPVITQDFILWTHRNVPSGNLAEFIAYAKANPKKVNAVSFGPAGITSLALERLKHTAGFDVTSIPYPGTSVALVALLGGTVDACVACATPGQAAGMQQQSLRPLASMGSKRSPLAPDVPTFKELGYPMLVVPGWTAMFATSTTPPDVLKKLRDAMARVMVDPAFRTQLTGAGMDMWEGTVEDFNAQVTQEAQQWSQDIKRIGLQLD